MALIGDRDRERAATQLTQHYVRGRLSLDELTERLDVALSARRASEVRDAFTGLEAPWHEQAAAARQAVEGTWRAARRVAFAVALWSLWWVASLLLLIGFTVSLVAGRVTWTNTAVVVAVWLGATFAVRRAAATTGRLRR
jgi:Domain of unknown function (DUF1707)